MADFLDLIRGSSAQNQNQQQNIKVSMLYATALENSHDGLVRVRFNGAASSLDSPAQITGDVSVVEWFNQDNDINLGADTTTDDEVESGSSDGQ